jgi:hypothetical protein
MGKSEDNAYSQEFVDGVIRDVMAWKKKNFQQQNSYNEAVAGNKPEEDTAYLKLNLTRKKIKIIDNANNNQQRVAGQETILDRDSVRKQRILQTNPNQDAGNGYVNRINPKSLKANCDAELPTSPIKDVALTCFGEASNGCASGANEKRAITDSIYNRVRANKSYWGGNSINGVLSKSGQYLAYEGSQYKKAETPEKLTEKECQKLKDCISAAQASAGGTQNNFTNFNQTNRAGRNSICNHYFGRIEECR